MSEVVKRRCVEMAQASLDSRRSKPGGMVHLHHIDASTNML
jgi:hypothetical protein